MAGEEMIGDLDKINLSVSDRSVAVPEITIPVAEGSKGARERTNSIQLEKKQG